MATHTTTHVFVHAWAETDVLAKDEHGGMTGMPRDGDPCAFPECSEPLRTGERAVAVIEVDRGRRVREKGEAWVGFAHPLHRVWQDGSVNQVDTDGKLGLHLYEGALMDSYLRDVARAAQSARNYTHNRNLAIKIANEHGHSLRAIAEAAELSHTAVAKILERDEDA